MATLASRRAAAGRTTDLGSVPQPPGDRHQLLHQLTHIFREAALGAVVAARDRAEDEVDRRVGRQRAVEDGEVPLQPVRDVVPAATWWAAAAEVTEQRGR